MTAETLCKQVAQEVLSEYGVTLTPETCLVSLYHSTNTHTQAHTYTYAHTQTTKHTQISIQLLAHRACVYVCVCVCTSHRPA